VIEALKTELGMSTNEISSFVGKEHLQCTFEGDLSIKTFEGDIEVSPGDYIIKGVNGEFYPCKPEIFEKTYEPVMEETIDDNKNNKVYISINLSMPREEADINMIIAKIVNYMEKELVRTVEGIYI
jgi:hypothetical protein